MSERDVVAATPIPRTRASLASDVRTLGVAPGDVVLVHCSLSAIGWVSGGAAAVILGLRDAVTETGTLIMPTQSAQLSDPGCWSRPAIPAQWHDLVRATMPAFDPRTTPSRLMGAVAEEFRTGPGVRRSPHPTCSFAALGPMAQEITARQPLEDPFGEDSPVARLSWQRCRDSAPGGRFRVLHGLSSGGTTGLAGSTPGRRRSATHRRRRAALGALSQASARRNHLPGGRAVPHGSRHRPHRMGRLGFLPPAPDGGVDRACRRTMARLSGFHGGRRGVAPSRDLNRALEPRAALRP